MRAEILSEESEETPEEMVVRLVFEDPIEDFSEPETSQTILAAIRQALGAEPVGNLGNLGKGVLEKRVAPHPGHFRPREKTGRFAIEVPEKTHLREQARGTSGRFVARLGQLDRAAAAQIAGQQIDVMGQMLSWHQGDLLSGGISEKEAARRGGVTIKHFYEGVFRNGLQAAGSPGLYLYARQKAMISRIIRDETDYWRGYMADVSAGRGTVPYVKRTAMYANAAREAYWLGWVLGDQRPGRKITWVIDPEADNCKTCKAMAEASPMSPQVFEKIAIQKGYLPQSGELECRGIQCKCMLTDKVS